MSAVAVTASNWKERHDRLETILLTWDKYDLRRVIEDALWSKEDLVELILDRDMLSDADMDEILKEDADKKAAEMGGYGMLLLNEDGTCAHYYVDLMNRCRRCAETVADEDVKRRDAGPFS